ncbi:hypothetical protein FRB95_000222 [Tulasnella sp. JGI-2019a]|nr:hypothetical protein FRB95_000222 [Tulasnella sp. JGI-2019a]
MAEFSIRASFQVVLLVEEADTQLLYRTSRQFDDQPADRHSFTTHLTIRDSRQHYFIDCLDDGCVVGSREVRHKTYFFSLPRFRTFRVSFNPRLTPLSSFSSDTHSPSAYFSTRYSDTLIMGSSQSKAKKTQREASHPDITNAAPDGTTPLVPEPTPTTTPSTLTPEGEGSRPRVLTFDDAAAPHSTKKNKLKPASDRGQFKPGPKTQEAIDNLRQVGPI